MGAEAPIPPAGVLPGSNEYGLWHNTLPVVDQIRVGVNVVEAKVKFFQTLPNIDTDRAVRGLVLGEICGDMVQGFHGASFSLDAGNKEEAMEGILFSWNEISLAIEKLGQYLPKKCQEDFKRISQEFAPKIASIKRMSVESLGNLAADLWGNYKGMYYDPKGMEKTDITYANQLATQYHQQWQQFYLNNRDSSSR